MSTEDKKNTTNALATGLKNFWGRIKGRTLFMLAGGTILVVAIILIVWMMRRSSNTSQSQLWVDWILAENESKNKEVIKSDKHQGKPTLTYLRVELARSYLHKQGLPQMGTRDSAAFEKAIQKIDEGRELYLKLTEEVQDEPILLQEAWFSAARGEEALIGAKVGKYQGDINKVIEYYKKAAAVKPDSEHSKEYAKTAEKIEQKKEAIVKFYQDLHENMSMTKVNAPHPK